MRDITLVELLKAGVHFGHQVSRWHPKMRPFIFTSRSGVYVIDLEKTIEQLKQAQSWLRELVGNGGVVLLVGTKRQAQPIVQAAAVKAGMPYVVERWLGGTFTNFPTILKVTKRLTHLKQERASGNLEKYTKKEQLEFNQEIARLEKLVGGIERMTKLPEAVFIIDVKQEKTALREASKVKIPVVALVDTNVSPEGIAYPIPANDDASKSIQLLTDAVVEAIEEGQQLAESRQVAQTAAAVPAQEPVAPVADESVSKAVPLSIDSVDDTPKAVV
ncbi:MAG: 30S ribosomal protein S2 [Candidatus Kerfeldbacteria bacterium]|nr:30S ribosomal protein S2 [Candidatus Kerfeldbacteria bacterium]